MIASWNGAQAVNSGFQGIYRAMAMFLLCFSIMSIFLPTSVEGVWCPNGWTQFDGYCYLYQKQSITFSQATKFCEDNHGYLAEIESEKENNFLVNFLKEHVVGDGVWLGGNDLLVDGYWVWEKSGNPFNYTSWGKGEPNQSSERQDCLSIWKSENYGWADHFCNRPDLAPLCETKGTICSRS